MRVRFCAGDFKGQGVKSLYATFIGNICVSVNPFAPMPYSPAWENTFELQDYLDSKVMPNCLANKKLQPHPWTTADLAFAELRDETKNQAVLICGESGSGKTEATKFVLQYLIGKNGASVDKLEDVRQRSERAQCPRAPELLAAPRGAARVRVPFAVHARQNAHVVLLVSATCPVLLRRN